MNVRLTEERKIKILNSEDIYKIMQQILLRENKVRRNQEHFWVVGLDNKNKVLFIELVSLGSVNSVQVNPPEVFRMAIYKLAVSMILVHNHTSGDTEPSNADRDLTDRMMKTGKLINIEVIDHLIISEEDYLSFVDTGILAELKRSGNYELLDGEKAAMRNLKEKMEREKAIKENNLEIAKRMKEDVVDIDIIKKYTGLTKWDIKGL